MNPCLENEKPKNWNMEKIKCSKINCFSSIEINSIYMNYGIKWTQNGHRKSKIPLCEGRGKMELQELNSTITYPYIEDSLIKALELTYPNKLPLNEIDKFELGRLIGQQDVINKLKYEKEYVENKTDDEDDEI